MNHVYALSAAGLALKTDEGIYTITKEGEAELGEFTPLPTGRALFDYWIGKKLKPTEARILGLVVQHRGLTSQEIADGLGMAMSGSFMNHVYHLCSLELMAKGDDRRYTVSPHLL